MHQVDVERTNPGEKLPFPLPLYGSEGWPAGTITGYQPKSNVSTQQALIEV